MKKFLVFAAMLLLLIPAVSNSKSSPDVLDKEDVKTSEGLAKYKVVGIREFSFEDMSYDNVDDDEKRQLKREMPEYQRDLARALKDELEDAGFDAYIIKDDGDESRADMIIEGEFTTINLGSAAARFIFGFGAGQCGVATKGKLVDAKSGDVLASFEHETTSGLDDRYDKYQMVGREVDDMAADIGEFVDKLR